MNKLPKKSIALLLCLALCLSGAITAYAVNEDKINEETEAVQETEKTAAEADETAEEVKKDINTPENSLSEGISKDETVYVLAGADGSVNKIIVSDWVKNGLNADSIMDMTALSDIENVKGNETYTAKGDATVWNAAGNDIYYQGNIEKELPVGMTVSYKLDGKAVTAEEIAGKSGRVTIRFDYENHQYENVMINGKEEKIYVPFAMLTGMRLDNNTFRNVQVSNGKIINDGENTAVVGIAFPGMQENLGISRNDLDIPDYVEITADVTDFSFGTTVTIATDDLLSDLDTSDLDSLGDLGDSLDELTDGMDKLLNGSSDLYDGLCTLLEKSEELVDGIDKLAEGAKELKDGAKTLDKGAGQIKAGADQLSAGLDTLKGNNDALNGGAKQVFVTLLSTAETQLKAAGLSVPHFTISNYAEVLGGIISSLDEKAVYEQALNQVTEAVEQNRPLIIEKVTAAVREQVKPQVEAAVKEQVTAGVTEAVREQVKEKVIKAATGISKADYDTAAAAGMIPKENQDAVAAAIEEQMKSDDVKALIEKTAEAKMATAEIKATVEANTDAQMKTDAVLETISENVEAQIKQIAAEQMESDEVKAKMAEASEGAQAVIGLKTSLDSYNAFYTGLKTYTKGVSTAADGAKDLAAGASELKDGTAQLKTGTATLYDGILELKNGVPALVDGVKKLKDGGMQLNDGLKKLNEEGIEKIVDLFDGDLEDFTDRIKAVVDAAENYNNFAGISEDMDGQVKFIYRTDEIE